MYASTLSACVEDYGGVEDCNSLQHTTAQRTVTSVVELGVVESGYKEGEREREAFRYWQPREQPASFPARAKESEPAS